MSDGLPESREVFDWLPTPLFLVSEEGTILGANRKGAEFLRFPSSGRLEGTSIIDYYLYPEDWEILTARLEKEGAVDEFEVMYRAADGEQVTAVESSRVETAADGSRRIVIIGREITGRLRLENELMHSNVQLIESNAQLQRLQSQLAQEKSMASLTTLAAGLAHEMNNPLGYFKSNVRTLVEYVKDLLEYAGSLESTLERAVESRETEAVRRIGELKERLNIEQIGEDLEDLSSATESGIERMAQITRSLGVFTEADERQTRFSPIEAVESALTLSRVGETDGVELQTELRESGEVNGSKPKLVQALVNLLLNAAEAAQSDDAPRPEHTVRPDDSAGGDRPARRNDADREPAMGAPRCGLVRVRLYGEGRWLHCEVSNSGKPISEEDRTRIFDPFFSTKPLGKGAGLGLTAVYQIVVRSFGGRIDVGSDGEMTTFTLRLPRAEGDQPPGRREGAE